LLSGRRIVDIDPVEVESRDNLEGVDFEQGRLELIAWYPFLIRLWKPAETMNDIDAFRGVSFVDQGGDVVDALSFSSLESHSARLRPLPSLAPFCPS